MRVMCVNHDSFSLDSYPWSSDDPQIGSEYEVIRTTQGADRKRKLFPAYVLKGFDKWVYDQRNFAILSDQSADDMADEKHEAIVNLETV